MFGFNKDKDKDKVESKPPLVVPNTVPEKPVVITQSKPINISQQAREKRILNTMNTVELFSTGGISLFAYAAPLILILFNLGLMWVVSGALADMNDKLNALWLMILMGVGSFIGIQFPIKKVDFGKNEEIADKESKNRIHKLLGISSTRYSKAERASIMTIFTTMVVVQTFILILMILNIIQTETDSSVILVTIASWAAGIGIDLTLGSSISALREALTNSQAK